MKLGLQISSFTWPGGPEQIGPTLARIARQADDVGFDSIWVMDHFFQIRSVGPAEEPMLEGMTTLGFMAAHTSARPARADGRRRPLPAPGAVGQGHDHARRPVGRPGLARHRRRLERGRVARASASRSRRSASASSCSRRRSRSPTRCGRASAARRAAFDGRQFHATRLMNSPQSLSRPRVPIMIGGGGEKKTLRLVAQYADATNVFGAPEAIARKYAILAEHCAAVGRDPDEIERSTLQNVRISTDGARRTETPAQIVDRFGELSDAGAQHVIVSMRHAHRPRCPRSRRLRRHPGAASPVMRRLDVRLHTPREYRPSCYDDGMTDKSSGNGSEPSAPTRSAA